MPTYVVIDDTEVAPEAPLTTSLLTRLRDNAIAYLGAPTGTKILVQQNVAPLGWTIDTTYNDRSLRITNGTLGTGGSVAFSTLFGRTGTDPFTLVQAALPSTTFTGSTSGTLTYTSPDVSTVGAQAQAGITQTQLWQGGNINGAAQTSGTLSVGVSSGGSAAALTPAIDMRVAYVDVKIVTKD